MGKAWSATRSGYNGSLLRNLVRAENLGGEMFEKVLFATDFSEYAQKTLECIGEIPGVKEVTLLHVVDATHPSKHGWTHGPHVENAKLLMEEKKEYLANLGLRVKTKVDVITEGDISREILNTAEKENSSLIGFKDSCNTIEECGFSSSVWTD